MLPEIVFLKKKNKKLFSAGETVCSLDFTEGCRMDLESDESTSIK